MLNQVTRATDPKGKARFQSSPGCLNMRVARRAHTKFPDLRAGYNPVQKKPRFVFIAVRPAKWPQISCGDITGYNK